MSNRTEVPSLLSARFDGIPAATSPLKRRSGLCSKGSRVKRASRSSAAGKVLARTFTTAGARIFWRPARSGFTEIPSERRIVLKLCNVTLDNYCAPEELGTEIASFVEYYNNERCHESLDNVTPAGVYYGRSAEILSRRERIKKQTITWH